MSRDKQIEEMECVILRHTYDNELIGLIATDLYNEGYRKVDEDYAIQCTCYALGCQMAETLKRKVAEEIFSEIEASISVYSYTTDGDTYDDDRVLDVLEWVDGKLDELKKKYTGGSDYET